MVALKKREKNTSQDQDGAADLAQSMKRHNIQLLIVFLELFI